MDWLTVVLGVVGFAGAGGALALFFLAPALLVVIVQSAERAIGAILATRIGCAAIVGVAAFIAADQVRSFADAHKCESRIVELKADAEAARLARDATITAEIERLYTARQAEDARAIGDLQQEVDDYDEFVATLPPGQRCLLRPDALSLREQSRTKPAGPARGRSQGAGALRKKP